MRLGVLAAARITGPAVMEPARLVDGVAVVAVAARSRARADEFAAQWNVPVAYDSYEALVTSPDVDAVYVATPASLHHRWTLAAVAAGKHVLCEKPLAANAPEARELVDAADAAGVVLMEAFHWRYHPLAGRIADVVASGRLGEIQRIEAVFDLPAEVVPRDDIRWDLSLGGGALMDLGCYPLQWVRFVAGAEPEVLAAEADCPVPEVDGRLIAELRWPSGLTGRVRCSMIEPAGGLRAGLDVFGSAGTMRVVNPLAPQHGAEIRVETPEGVEVDRIAPSTRVGVVDSSTGVGVVDSSTTYVHQLVAFRDAVASGTTPPTGGADSIATMELIDACYRAAGLVPRPSLPR